MSTASTRPPVASPNHRPDIDGLRAVSIALVLVYHGFERGVPGGYVGVDVFFVISGYLITGQILSRAAARGFSFADFYARRIRRILPPLCAVLILAAAYGTARLGLSDFTGLFRHIAHGAIFTSNFLSWSEAGYFDKLAEQKPLLHLWSLAIEEQFYIFWPLVIAALAFASGGRRAPVPIVIAVLCVASLAYGIRLTNSNATAAFYSPFARFWELGLGGWLASFEQSKRQAPSMPAWRVHGLSIAGLALIVGAAILLNKMSRFPGWLALAPTVGAACVLAAGPTGVLNRLLLASRPMVELGLVSYALYLWHWPLLAFLRLEGMHDSSLATAAVLLGAVALAFATRTVIESPLRYHPSRWIPAGLLAALAVIGVIGLLGTTRVLMPSRLGPQLAIEQADRFDTRDIPAKPCDAYTVKGSISSRYCTVWGRDTAPRTIAVWGDSMSNAWIPPFLTLARSGEFRVIQMSHAACPPLLGVWRTSGFSKEWCSDGRLQSELAAVLASIRPESIFLIARWNLYYQGHFKDDRLVEASFITDGPGDADAASARRAFAAAMPRTVAALAAHSKVVIVKDVPLLKVPIDVGLTRRPDDYERTLASYRAFEADIDDIIDAAVGRQARAASLSPATRLCDETKCHAFLSGVPAYSDETHLTAAAALAFGPDIARTLDP